jgi:enoyl-CoA hydratase/carnithine racemase
MKKVKLYREHGIAWIVLNRPDKRNAIDYDVMSQLTNVLDEIEANAEDKVVVITGEGEQAFCSGGDLSIFHQLHTKKDSQEMLTKMGEILFRLFFFPKPTVAAVNGTAVGGGCEIATACDFRIVAPHAKLGFVQGTLGITTGWGASTMLYERMTQTTAMEMLMTCKRYTAQEAKSFKFVQEIITNDDFRAGCVAWLQPFLQQQAAVLGAYKKRWIDYLDKDQIKIRFDKEIDECSTLWETDEHHDAVKRFLSKS